MKAAKCGYFNLRLLGGLGGLRFRFRGVRLRVRGFRVGLGISEVHIGYLQLP